MTKIKNSLKIKKPRKLFDKGTMIVETIGYPIREKKVGFKKKWKRWIKYY